MQEDNFENGLLSALGTYENGKLTINNAFEIVNPVPSVNLRKHFNIEKTIKSARLYASAQVQFLEKDIIRAFAVTAVL